MWKILKICLVIRFDSYTNVTHGQTDTGRRHRSHLCIASRGKNCIMSSFDLNRLFVQPFAVVLMSTAIMPVMSARSIKRARHSVAGPTSRGFFIRWVTQLNWRFMLNVQRRWLACCCSSCCMTIRRLWKDERRTDGGIRRPTGLLREKRTGRRSLMHFEPFSHVRLTVSGASQSV